MHDHRKLGRELGLFDTDPLIGAGLPYWLPDGAAVRHALEEYIRGVERRAGYRHVYSPVLASGSCTRLSGHCAHYSDDMFPPMDLGDEQLVLRPMLCPHHALIYRSRPHSYRELPLRIAELGGMFRSELSGVLGGLTRVRAIQLNDAHIFCTPDQVGRGGAGRTRVIRGAYEALAIAPGRYRLSLSGAGGKYVAEPDMWRRASALLRDVLDASGLAYDAVEGEAAFYGPKIDVQVTGRARPGPCQLQRRSRPLPHGTRAQRRRQRRISRACPDAFFWRSHQACGDLCRPLSQHERQPALQEISARLWLGRRQRSRFQLGGARLWRGLQEGAS